MDIKDWPRILRANGVKVVETPGWLGRSHGGLRDVNIVWHHDASKAGRSPGALNYMINNWNNASAQIWVDMDGVWHFVGVGQAYHAGRTNSSAFTNGTAIGIETDHTIHEAWPSPQINSLRFGTAVLLKAHGKSSANLSFHKSIAVPAGRKSDPDGLDLATERNNVQTIINGKGTLPTAPTPPVADSSEDLLVALSQYDQELVRNTIVESVGILREISERLRVPGQPFDWLPAIANQIAALDTLDGGDVDVEKLAGLLKASLAEDVAKALGEKLTA